MDGAVSVEPEILPGLVGVSESMQEVAELVRRIAPKTCAVLIHGESGTGKDVVAGLIHSLSERPGECIAIGAGCLPETIADAELFGSTRGAYTGSTERSGYLSAANHGTLFFDDIPDLHPLVQAKLLRVLEGRSARRLGAMRTYAADVRFVCATNRPHADDGIRADLYYRLSTVIVRLPPLRARPEDIVPIARARLRVLEPELGHRELSRTAEETLVAYDWPGNVRELSAVLYRAAIATDRREISAEALRVEGIRKKEQPPDGRPRSKPEEARAILERVGNVARAAREAGVPRSTFRAWLARPLRTS